MTADELRSEIERFEKAVPVIERTRFASIATKTPGGLHFFEMNKAQHEVIMKDLKAFLGAVSTIFKVV